MSDLDRYEQKMHYILSKYSLADLQVIVEHLKVFTPEYDDDGYEIPNPDKDKKMRLWAVAHNLRNKRINDLLAD